MWKSINFIFLFLSSFSSVISISIFTRAEIDVTEYSHLLTIIAPIFLFCGFQTHSYLFSHYNKTSVSNGYLIRILMSPLFFLVIFFTDDNFLALSLIAYKIFDVILEYDSIRFQIKNNLFFSSLVNFSRGGGVMIILNLCASNNFSIEKSLLIISFFLFLNCLFFYLSDKPLNFSEITFPGELFKSCSFLTMSVFLSSLTTNMSRYFLSNVDKHLIVIYTIYFSLVVGGFSILSATQSYFRININKVNDRTAIAIFIKYVLISIVFSCVGFVIYCYIGGYIIKGLFGDLYIGYDMLFLLILSSQCVLFICSSFNFLLQRKKIYKCQFNISFSMLVFSILTCFVLFSYNVFDALTSSALIMICYSIFSFFLYLFFVIKVYRW